MDTTQVQNPRALHQENGRSPERSLPIHSGASAASPKVEEYRNMMQHILNKIHKRRRPPTALAYLAECYRSIEHALSFENDERQTIPIGIMYKLTYRLASGHGSYIIARG
ncbi:hypothetical protein BX666DRAFT_1995395 [Dichotomocladium elegans]|nr:hypothetical protein BX666DRAFT_1995395 [Dichotomocladium elegans]